MALFLFIGALGAVAQAVPIRPDCSANGCLRSVALFGDYGCGEISGAVGSLVEVDLVIVPLGEHTDVAFCPLSGPQWRTEESLRWLRGLLDRE